MNKRARMPRAVACVLFGLAWVALAVGCSSTPPPPEGAAVVEQALSGPFTITLSAPNPVSPIGPVLEGSNGVTVNSSSTVVNGTVVAMGTSGFSAGVSAVLNNDVWSRGTAHFASSVRVRGTLHAASSVLGLGDVIASTDTTPTIDPASTLSWTVTYPSGTATNLTVPQNGTQSASPGLYGTVSVGSHGTLSLSAGTYYMSSFTVSPQAKVTMNQATGPVIIYVSTSISLGGTFYNPAPDGGSGTAPDLFIGYFGSAAFTVGDTSCTLISGTCGPFNGAIVAPSATLTLQAISGSAHTGFFAAPSIVLASGAQVQYRLPTALVAASHPGGTFCAQLLADSGVDPSLVAHYCTLCGSLDDTDHDGVPDCVDGCPYDRTKTAPGVCGCNTPDTDSDGDGVPDCIDQCPNDPNNVTNGQCGCVGEPGLAAAGTPCTDTACPQTGATCNGAGVCGNRAACSPCSGGVFVENGDTSYWICGNTLVASTPDGGTESVSTGAPATQSQAMTDCGNKGLTLTRVSSSAENQFLKKLISKPLWLGANDISSSGTWRWATPTSNNGDIFWSGGATGTPQNGLYSNWGSGAPGSNTCASMRPGDGAWFDTSCGEVLGFMCEYQPPPLGQPLDAGGGYGGWGNGVGVGGNGGGGGGAHQPINLELNCVQPFDLDAGGLPDSLAELANELDAAKHGVFYGIAANPPPDGLVMCPAESADAAASEALGLVQDSGAGCWFANAQQVPFPSGGLDGGPYMGPCASDDDCTKNVGADYVCRQFKSDPNCKPPDAGEATVLDAGSCVGASLCTQLECPPPTTTTCREVRLCSPQNTSFDASLDPTSNLDAGTFNPANLFDGALPDASPSAAYYDPSLGDGAANTWCHMNPQNPVPAANQPKQNTNGSSGHGSPISFSFDPNLVFNVNANPLAMGENAMDLHAAATLKATVSLTNFLDQNYTADIVDIGAGVHAQRCSVNNDETTFTVLGVDIASLTGLGIPHFDSSEGAFAGATTDCNNAVANFQLAADRAKKAFRDAQQLLKAYKDITSDGGIMASSLCQDILGTIDANDVGYFPGGLACPAGETVEETINRFVDYLQAPGFGQISQVRQSAQELVNKSSEIVNGVLPNLNHKFLDITENESQTILDVPFAIGPVPMILQIDVFANYGINGVFKLDVHFPFQQMAGLDDSNTTQPGDGSATPIEIAHTEVDVIPYAAAGLSAFVGAGVDLGAFSADLGIEGSVTLGQVSAPVYAGAGLDLLEQFDPRPIPSDISPVSLAGSLLGTKFQFSAPKSFNMMVWFDYGAGIQLSNILAGEIDARLHISLFFFSATWRVQIVHFNGWSKFFNLVNGRLGASTASRQTNGLGTSHMPAPTGNTTVVSTGKQGPSAGLAEPQLPLTVLTSLTVPVGQTAGPPDGDGGQAGPTPVKFDMSNVKGFFYDSLCCAHNAESCNVAGSPQCCPDYACKLNDAGALDSGVCVPQCIVDGGTCRTGAGVGCCGADFCGTTSTCQSCANLTEGCNTTNHQCCSGFTCGATGSCCIQSQSETTCSSSADCCNGTCIEGECI